ncbi:hypothetical protein U1Q18_007046 [Sarracenia purpurea var. burkii]
MSEREREREAATVSLPIKAYQQFIFPTRFSAFGLHRQTKMGEEEKKTEEKKPDEPKKAEQDGKQEKKEEPKTEKPIEAKKPDEPNDSKDPPPPPPPPQEIILKVYMHCEGCARKVRRCLKGFQGVEDVQTDCKTHKVVVKGEKADPVKVVERVQRKSHRQVELLSPIPKPPAEDAKKVEDQKEVAKPVEKQEEPQVITVVLKVHMHCEACAQEIKRRMLRMNGVENVEPDLKSSQVTVKGVFDPQKLVEYVYKRTGKQASIVKQEPEKKEKEKEKEKETGTETEKGTEEKKAEDGGDEGSNKKGEEGAKEEKGGEGEAATATMAVAEEGEEETANVLELRKNEFYYNYPQNHQYYAYPARFESNPYPPQIFSDENPNACSVM